MLGSAKEPVDMMLASVLAARAAVDAYRALPAKALAELGEDLAHMEAAVREVGTSVAEVLRTRTDISPMAYRSVVAERCFAVLEACARQERALRRVGAAASLCALQDKLTALSELLEKSAAEAAVAAAPDGGQGAFPVSAMPGESADIVFLD